MLLEKLLKRNLCHWRIQNGEKLKTCEIYDASANEWQLIASLNVLHYHGCMICLNGKLFVLGVRNERNQSELSVECFDSARDSWILTEKIPATNYINPSIGCILRLTRKLLGKHKVLG